MVMGMRRHFTLGCAALLAGFGGLMLVPSTSDAQVRARFNSGNFKGAYSSRGGFRGVYDGGNVKVAARFGGYGRGYYGGRRGYYGRNCWGYGRRYNCYYPTYISWGPINYGYYTPANYIPYAYQQPVADNSKTTSETVNNSPNSIIINSEKTIIYNTPAGTNPAGLDADTPHIAAEDGSQVYYLAGEEPESIPTLTESFSTEPVETEASVIPATHTTTATQVSTTPEPTPDPPITYRYAGPRM